KMDTEVVKGLNYVSYDLTRNVLKSPKRKKDDETHVKGLKAADNGKYYLTVGEYTVEYSKGEKLASATLKVVER
ncbi:MAG: hypothetical protein KJP00_11070, partial [Bacteroidia bacterium]|nr:hypothetical protein [Bacteroidia bacterium]